MGIIGIIGIKIDFVNEIKVLGIIGIIGIKVIFVNEIKVLGIIGFKVVIYYNNTFLIVYLVIDVRDIQPHSQFNCSSKTFADIIINNIEQ